MLSNKLEKTLNRAFEFAATNKHEYVTLEHLLFALIDDEDASEVLLACNIDIEELRAILNDFITNELTALKLNKGEEVKPTASFQRVIQRAANHVQMSGSEEVTGANILVAIFSERERIKNFLEQKIISSSFKNVICLSIGGSRLGQELLSEFQSNEGPLRTYFCSSFDLL